MTLTIRNDGTSDSGEQFRTIVQRNSLDAASSSLDRSNFVSINDASYTENPDDLGVVANILAHIIPIAYAAEKPANSSDGFRYPFGSGAYPLSEGWSTAQDLGTFYIADRWHLGEDWNLNVPVHNSDSGKDVVATYGGKVVYAKDNGDERFGNTVVIEHDLGNKKVYSLYAHLDAIDSKYAGLTAPRDIAKGVGLGTVGKSGGDGKITEHLHFEIFEVNNGAFFQEYLNGGTPIGSHWGYSESPSAAASEPDERTTDKVSYTEGNFTWYNPSIFIDKSFEVISGSADKKKDAFFGLSNAISATLTNIVAWGIDVLFTANDYVQLLLKHFEELHVGGGTNADTVNIGALTGTTIEQNTIFFDGGAGNDVLNGSSTDRRIVAEGGLGNDSLTGGSSNDILNGSAGNDNYEGRSGVDTIDFSSTIRGIFVNLAAVSNQATGPEIGTDQIARVENVIGGSGADRITGNVAANQLVGGEGNDILNSGVGNDTLDGGIGADTMRGGAGDDKFLVDGAGDKVLEAASQGNDTLIASATYVLQNGSHVEVLQTPDAAATTKINLSGNDLQNTLIGNAAANSLNGKGSADTLQGGKGNDSYYVDNAGDEVIENANQGTDNVNASVSYALQEGNSVETLRTVGPTTTAAIDLTGNSFANRIIGNAGSNVINGGGRKDVLTGGMAPTSSSLIAR